MSAPFERDFGVVIGVGDYPGFEDLKSAKDDAERVFRWLVSPDGGGVPRGNCLLISSSTPPPEPEQSKIDNPLLALIDKANLLAARGRRLYLYFSGHGITPPRTDDVSLCLPTWSERMRRASLSLREYLETLKQSGSFKQIVVWIDCCRVRSFNVEGLPPQFGLPKPDKDTGETRSFVAQASEFQAPAFEAKRGLFTQALLEGLEGGAAVDGRVTAARLATHIRNRTEQLAKEAGVSQRGVVGSEFDDTEEFDFGVRRSAPAATPRKSGPPPRALESFSPPGGSGPGAPQSPPFFSQPVACPAPSQAPFSPAPSRFELIVPLVPGLCAQVIDAAGRRVVEDATATVSVSLAPGPYVVRGELGDLFEEVHVVVGPSASSATAPIPALPIVGLLERQRATLSHEYYSYPAKERSATTTRAPLGRDPEERRAHLMIFVRALDENAAPSEPRLGEGLSLSGPDGTVTPFDHAGVERGDAGWSALAAYGPPGPYTLHTGGARQMHLAVHVYAGWSTRVFLLQQRGVHFEDASLFLGKLDEQSKPEAFDPDSAALQRTAAALVALQSGARVARSQVEDVLAGEFEDPLLGLAVAHTLLAQGDAAQLRPVIARLGALVGPDAPDVLALAIAEATALGGPIPRYTPTAPPMLRAGLDALIDGVDRDPTLLPPESFVERVAMRARRGGPWTVWETNEPRPVLVGGVKYLVNPEPNDLAIGFARGFPSGGKSFVRFPPPAPFLEPWVKETVDAAKARGPIDAPRLARSLGLPTRVIEAAIRG